MAGGRTGLDLNPKHRTWEARKLQKRECRAGSRFRDELSTFALVHIENATAHVQVVGSRIVGSRILHTKVCLYSYSASYSAPNLSENEIPRRLQHKVSLCSSSSFNMSGSFFPALVVFLLLIASAVFISFLGEPSKARKFTESLPWIGSAKGAMAWLQAVLRSITQSEQMVQEGYIPVNEAQFPTASNGA
jgi:hypothetical protein